jgi:hypothetical protein
MKSPYKMNFIQFEMGTKRHEKEIRVSNPNEYFRFPSYFYGKMNNFYNIKLSIGQQKLIGGKSNKNGVGVSFNYAIGFSAGLLRPYYIYTYYDIDTIARTVKLLPTKYEDPNKEVFLNNLLIHGGTGLRYGWNEMTFVPGFHGKTSLRFDWARFNQLISAVEIGFEFDYYTQKVVQMVNNPGRSFFPTGYIGLVFGNRK